MSRYALSPLAQADLSDIWDYSYSQWGADQADAYVLVIHEACEGLVTAMANLKFLQISSLKITFFRPCSWGKPANGGFFELENVVTKYICIS